MKSLCLSLDEVPRSRPPRIRALRYHGYMQKNTVSHFEIYADDPDNLAKFYTDMFDWQITAVPGMDYRIAVKT